MRKIHNLFKLDIAGLLWNVFIFFVSLFAVILVAYDFILGMPPKIKPMYQFLDNFVCGIFLTEFIVRFSFTNRKKEFLRTHWLDLLGSIPFEIFRFARIARLLLIYRSMRAIGKAMRMRKLMLQKNSATSLAIDAAVFIFLSTIFLMITSSFFILVFETDKNSNIQDTADAIWWSWVTITTVGYGDYFPVTFWGRVIASVLMMFGIALFSTITVTSSTLLLNFAKVGIPSAPPPAPSSAKVEKELNELRKMMTEMKQQLKALAVKNNAKVASSISKKKNNASGKKLDRKKQTIKQEKV